MISGASLTIVIHNSPDEILLNITDCCLDKYSWNETKIISILGDFNIPSAKWTTFPAESPKEIFTFLTFSFLSNFLQLKDEPPTD